MPVDAINVRPIIRELVRTNLCFPDIQLLVDRICTVKLPPLDDAERSQAAYSLYLTDRVKSIQAVIKSRLHRRIHHGEIKEGSIVVLKDYELAQAKRLNGDGSVVHLKISDFYPIGEEDRPYQRFAVVGDVEKERSDQPAAQQSFLQETLTKDEAVASKSVTGFGPEKDLSRTHGIPSSRSSAKLKEGLVEDFNAETSSQSKQLPSQKRPPDTALDELDPTPQKRPRECRSETNSPIGESHPRKQNQQSPEPKAVPYLDPATSHQTAASLLKSALNPPSPSKPPSTNQTPQPPPLHLSSLASVTHPHTSKNELHNFLALITSVSPSTTKPPRMPRKRDFRIMDTSTSKQVLLSVFTDPVGFRPKVGTIAVFSGLVTHDWDGGNLKAYPWNCEGREWCRVVDEGAGEWMGGVEGVEEGEVEGLRGLRRRVVGGDGRVSTT